MPPYLTRFKGTTTIPSHELDETVAEVLKNQQVMLILSRNTIINNQLPNEKGAILQYMSKYYEVLGENHRGEVHLRALTEPKQKVIYITYHCDKGFPDRKKYDGPIVIYPYQFITEYPNDDGEMTLEYWEDKEKKVVKFLERITIFSNSAVYLEKND